LERVVADAPGHKGTLTVAGMIRAAPDLTDHRSILTYWKTGDKFFKPPPLARPSTAYKARRILVKLEELTREGLRD
jgi:hypothetical protein